MAGLFPEPHEPRRVQAARGRRGRYGVIAAAACVAVWGTCTLLPACVRTRGVCGAGAWVRAGPRGASGGASTKGGEWRRAREVGRRVSAPDDGLGELRRRGEVGEGWRRTLRTEHWAWNSMGPRLKKPAGHVTRGYRLVVCTHLPVSRLRLRAARSEMGRAVGCGKRRGIEEQKTGQRTDDHRTSEREEMPRGGSIPHSPRALAPSRPPLRFTNLKTPRSAMSQLTLAYVRAGSHPP